MVQAVFNGPMISHQLEHAQGWGLLHRETAESINDFMAKLMGFEDAHRTLQTKHLLNALPLLVKPLIEIRATDDLSMFEPPVRLVPGLIGSPASPIWGTILEQVRDIL